MSLGSKSTIAFALVDFKNFSFKESSGLSGFISSSISFPFIASAINFPIRSGPFSLYILTSSVASQKQTYTKTAGIDVFLNSYNLEFTLTPLFLSPVPFETLSTIFLAYISAFPPAP